MNNAPPWPPQGPQMPPSEGGNGPGGAPPQQPNSGWQQDPNSADWQQPYAGYSNVPPASSNHQPSPAGPSPQGAPSLGAGRVTLIIVSVIGVILSGALAVGLSQQFNDSGKPKPTIAEPKPDPDVETLNPSPTTAQPTDQTGEPPDVVNKPPENPSWLPEQKWPTIPTPPIKTELERKLISNWLYKYYVPIPRGCPTIDPKQNQAQYKANAQKLVDCLYNAWEPIFADAGNSLNKPKLHFYKKTVETPCNTIGKGYWTFYCPRNETIYISEAEMTNPDTRYRPYATMFHEFIHHVQASAGIFDAMDWNGDKRAEHIRRLQLQGQCLEARQLILTDVVDFKIADYDEFVKEQLTGIDKTLGKPKTAVYWGVLGFYVQRIDECNTWAAPSDSVK